MQLNAADLDNHQSSAQSNAIPTVNLAPFRLLIQRAIQHHSDCKSSAIPTVNSAPNPMPSWLSIQYYSDSQFSAQSNAIPTVNLTYLTSAVAS
jgi:hypothetical protein